MTILVPALSGALLVLGLIGLAVGLTPAEPRAAAPRAGLGLVRRWAGTPRRTRWLAAAGLASGVVAALASGFLAALVVVPAAVVGLPWLLAAPGNTHRVARLEAMAEWTRSLSGVLTVGVGLEQALTATLRSTPEAIKPEVARLAARLRARWSTEDALRAFADDLDDATGDLIAGALILGSRRRGAGLAAVLEGLAESVAADVTARRQVDADQAKPRTAARSVTLITVAVLGIMALTGENLAPYRTPIGQLILAVLLALYAGGLVWLRRMSTPAGLPRFLGAHLRGAHA